MIGASGISYLVFAVGRVSDSAALKCFMLHALDDGVSILAKAIGTYSEVFEVVNVVAREGDQDVIALIQREAAVSILNLDSTRGISQSVITGVRSTKPTKGCLCALGGMPYISVTTINSLVGHLSADNIVVPRTSLGNGNPVALGENFRQELLNLKGNVGAKPVVKRYADSVCFYECDDQNIHRDIDQPSDIL